MLKCILLDDELPGLAYLKMLCEQIPELSVVKAFNDPQLFLEESSRLQFDFCIIDIEMPRMNGLQVASLLKGKPVIFATAYKDFAAEAYDLDVIDYLRKPIKQDRLAQAMIKIKNHIETRGSLEDSFTINTDRGKSIIYFKDLLYIITSTVDARDKEVFLGNGTTLIFKNLTFEKLQQQLPALEFLRINKKQIVAKKIIRSYTATEIISTLLDTNGNELRFNLSDIYRDAVLTAIQG
jgi:DNA-binding LytR/AlgR family response regulator